MSRNKETLWDIYLLDQFDRVCIDKRIRSKIVETDAEGYNVWSYEESVYIEVMDNGERTWFGTGPTFAKAYRDLMRRVGREEHILALQPPRATRKRKGAVRSKLD